MHILSGRSTSLIGYTNTNRGVAPCLSPSLSCCWFHMLPWGLDAFGSDPAGMVVTRMCSAHPSVYRPPADNYPFNKDAGLQYFSEDFLFFHTFPLLWLFTYDKSLLILRRGFLPPSPRPEQHSPSALSVPPRTLRLTPRTRLHALRAHLSHSHRAGDPVYVNEGYAENRSYCPQL